METLLTVKQVSAWISLSRSTIDRKRREGTFPLPIQLSNGRIAWEKAEIDEWLAKKKARAERLAVIQSEKNGAIYE